MKVQDSFSMTRVKLKKVLPPLCNTFDLGANSAEDCGFVV